MATQPDLGWASGPLDVHLNFVGSGQTVPVAVDPPLDELADPDAELRELPVDELAEEWATELDPAALEAGAELDEELLGAGALAVALERVVLDVAELEAAAIDSPAVERDVPPDVAELAAAWDDEPPC